MTSCPLTVFAFASRRASILYFTIGSGMNLANAGSASSRRDASSRRTFIAAKVLSQRKEKGLREGGADDPAKKRKPGAASPPRILRRVSFAVLELMRTRPLIY